MAKKLFNRGFKKPDKVTAPSRTKVFKPKEPEITLDSQQNEIVYSDKSNILVAAGAGSGKTRVLTERIKHLITSGVKPSGIVAITFTNMAAEELKERLRDVDNIGDAFIGTIHSFANKIMQNSNKEYTIYNDSLDIEYHRHLIERYCHKLTFTRYLEYKDIKDSVEMGKVDESALKGFLVPSEKAELQIIERSAKELASDVASWYHGTEIADIDDRDILYPESIGTLCEDNNVIDFNQLLQLANDYFRTLGTRVEHLFVDELQDVGSLEWGFINGLNAVNTFFVGDDWQSIYWFKGGNVNIFLSLSRDPYYTTYFLTNNYRNCEQVLDLAHIVIEQVSNKLSKDVAVMNETTGEVVIKTRAFLPYLIDIINETDEYRDWFILVRTNQELFKVNDILSKGGIPCETFKRDGMSLSDMKTKLYRNSVKVLTVHTAKGLEAKNVVLYGKFPVYCPSYLNNEDERKVMYVGVTRAKERLYVLN